MDEIMESRCQGYEDQIKELKAKCSELAERNELANDTIKAMQIQVKDLEDKLKQEKRKNEIYAAQIDIVYAVCGVAQNKKKER
mgnify:CR=1 FL=1|jgi:chromosome segregation ATPase